MLYDPVSSTYSNNIPDSCQITGGGKTTFAKLLDEKRKHNWGAKTFYVDLTWDVDFNELKNEHIYIFDNYDFLSDEKKHNSLNHIKQFDKKILLSDDDLGLNKFHLMIEPTEVKAMINKFGGTELERDMAGVIYKSKLDFETQQKMWRINSPYISGIAPYQNPRVVNELCIQAKYGCGYSEGSIVDTLAVLFRKSLGTEGMLQSEHKWHCMKRLAKISEFADLKPEKAFELAECSDIYEKTSGFLYTENKLNQRYMKVGSAYKERTRILNGEKASILDTYTYSYTKELLANVHESWVEMADIKLPNANPVKIEKFAI